MTQFAVALPVYNGGRYLREALDSVVSQDYGDFEIFVSDNCSTDDTPSILAEYSARDRRVRFSRADRFLPQAQNANRAVELCDAEWVKLLCHDDLLAPGCMRALSEAVSSNAEGLGLVGHGEEWLFENGARIQGATARCEQISAWNGRDYVRRLLVAKAPAPLPSLTTAMVRKEAWSAAGRFDDRFVHFDVFLWVKVLVRWRYAYVPRVLATTRIHGAQVAVSSRKSQRSFQDHRTFWPDFVRLYRHELDLGWAENAGAILKPLVVAGAHVAIELIRRQPARALEMVRGLPVHYLPLLPLFVARGLRTERAKVRRLHPTVPMDMIYPG
jgi:glycosyltransferase involved in cell wall biosynthesis